MNRLCLLLVLLTGCVKSQHGIPNFAQVDAGIWRGGQPTDAGWIYLKSLGVSNDVKLNLEEPGDKTAVLMGIKLYDAPMDFTHQLGIRPIPKDFFEDLLVALPAGGTFIHCEKGQDRTGLFVAIWRHRWDGWSKADAEKEMLAHGFHKELHGLWECWENLK